MSAAGQSVVSYGVRWKMCAKFHTFATLAYGAARRGVCLPRRYDCWRTDDGAAARTASCINLILGRANVQGETGHRVMLRKKKLVCTRAP